MHTNKKWVQVVAIVLVVALVATSLLIVGSIF